MLPQLTLAPGSSPPAPLTQLSPPPSPRRPLLSLSLFSLARGVFSESAEYSEAVFGTTRALALGRYTCPNGHRYAIGNCGKAMVKAKCIECGAPIGGSDHQSLANNKRLFDSQNRHEAANAKADSKRGYMLECTSGPGCENTERKGLSPVGVRLVRLVLHALLGVAAAASPGRGAIDVAALLYPEKADGAAAASRAADYGDGAPAPDDRAKRNTSYRAQTVADDCGRALETLHRRLHEDWGALRAMLTLESDEDVALAVHLALRAWRRELPNRSCAGRAAFDSTEARASFEAELMRRVVEPALGDGLARALRAARDELAALASESGLRAMIGPELCGRAPRARARARAAPHRG